MCSDNLIGDDSLVFYVGASRARFNLVISSQMDEEDCKRVAIEYNLSTTGNIEKKIAAKLNTLLVK